MRLGTLENACMGFRQGYMFMWGLKMRFGTAPKLPSALQRKSSKRVLGANLVQNPLMHESTLNHIWVPETLNSKP